MKQDDIKKRLAEIDVEFRTADNPHVRNCPYLIELFGEERLEWKGKAKDEAEGRNKAAPDGPVQVTVKGKGLLADLLEPTKAGEKAAKRK